MKIYLITLAGAMILSLCAERLPLRRKDLERGRPDAVWVCLLIAFLVVISGFRYMNYDQSDENNYRYMVTSAMGQPFDWSKIGLDKEWLFYILIWICANVFKDDQALIFIAALITNVLIILFFTRYARPFWFAIFLYICSGAFASSMNVLRQYIAVAILLWCYPLAKKRKLVPYVLLVVLASAVHQSALIMLPVYLVLRRDRFDVWTGVAVAVAVVIFANFESVMTAILPSTSYDSYLDNILSGGYGVKWIRVAAWLLPYILILVFHRYLNSQCGLSYDILYAVLLGACISVVSTQYVYVARIESYFAIVAYLAVIKIPKLFTPSGQRFAKWAMVVLFFAFGLYQHLLNPAYHNILFENISGVL